MNITFEKFTEKHIDEAVKLALAELENERKQCPDLLGASKGYGRKPALQKEM